MLDIEDVALNDEKSIVIAKIPMNQVLDLAVTNTKDIYEV